MREKYLDQMSDEMKASYKAQGEAYFRDFDFKEGKMVPDLERTSARHILASIKSGIRFDDLDEDERQLVVKIYGENWMSVEFD